MFKTLLGTFLLCSSIGLQKPKENAITNPNNISGPYTFSDEFDFSYFLSISATTSQHISLDGATNAITYFYASGTSTGNTLNCDLRIDYYYDDYYEIYINDSLIFSDWRYENVGIDDVEDDTSLYFVQNFIMNFGSTVVLPKVEKALFDVFFSKESNSYVTYVDSYYHFRNDDYYEGGYAFAYDGFIYFLSNDGIFNSIDINSVSYLNSIYIFSKTFDSSNGSYQTGGLFPYMTGTYTNIGNIKITGLLPYMLANALSDYGVFEFVPNTTGSTWQDMIFSVMDAPIYYLTQLFNFELFGINLFVAFSSLLTLVIVIVVIRKVI